MKKKLLIASVAAFLLPCLTGCDTEPERTDLKNITFTTYLGSASKRKIEKLDFENNLYSCVEIETFSVDNKGAREKAINSSINLSFTDDDEAKFLKKFAKAKPSKLQDVHGDANLDRENLFEIEYANGDTFTSKGYKTAKSTKASETAKEVYNKLGTYCFELIGNAVFPRNDSKVYRNKFERKPVMGDNLNSSCYFPLEQGNYKWNKKTKNDADLYELNSKHKNNLCTQGGKYFVRPIDGMVYYEGEQERNFKKIVLTSYDFCKELTNKNVVADFVIDKAPTDDADVFAHQTLELNKIYTVDYIFGNDDYYQYTFNTFTGDKKISSGRYYSPSKNYFGYLDIRNDNTFTYQFAKNEDLTDCNEDYKATGNYEFQNFSGVEKLVLNMGDDKVLVYDVNYGYLIADSSNSTYDRNAYAKDTVEGTKQSWGVEATLKYMPIEIL